MEKTVREEKHISGTAAHTVATPVMMRGTITRTLKLGVTEVRDLTIRGTPSFEFSLQDFKNGLSFGFSQPILLLIRRFGLERMSVPDPSESRETSCPLLAPLPEARRSIAGRHQAQLRIKPVNRRYSLRICSMIQSLISATTGRIERLRGGRNSQTRRVVESDPKREPARRSIANAKRQSASQARYPDPAVRPAPRPHSPRS